MAVQLRSLAEIEIMRVGGKINAEALMRMREAVRPGVTTGELDQIAAEVLARHGARPAFLGHPKGGRHPFPAVITASINEQLVHGIPGKRRLEQGDLVSLDCGTLYKGFVADSAFSMGVGKVKAEVERLMKVTERSLYEGIEQCVAGNRIGDISYAVQSVVEENGYHVVREYGGHGVGRAMWEEPHIANWGERGKGLRLKAGMTFALEPMVMPGDPTTKVLNDHWTVVMADGGLCAHFEHTIAVTENGPEILTKME